MNQYEIILYTTSTGKKPFSDWLEELDLTTRAIIASRLARIRAGNFGDCKPIQGNAGIWEFRINYGSGYRIYFGKYKATIIILLLGGDKSSQIRDIAKAERYWIAYKRI